MQRFCEQLDALIDARHVGATYAVCARAGDPSLLLRCELVLRPHKLEADWSASIERHGLIVERGWVDIGKFREAIDESGTLLVANRKFTLPNRSGISGWSASRRDAGAYSSLTTYELRATGMSIADTFGSYDALSFVQRRLPSFTPPFRDWLHLAAYLAQEQAIDAVSSSSIAILAPTFAIVESFDVTSERRLVINVGAHEALGDLTVVVIADDDDWPSRTSPGASWSEAGPNSWRATVDCSELVGPATIQLLFRDECVHQVRFGIPLLATRAHLALDDQMKWLEGLLGTGTKAPKSDGFEVGVANLLALCGLAPVHYGHGSRDEFPDIMCAVHENLLLVAECTVGAPPPSKIDDLVARAEHVRARTNVAGERVKLLRVVFTARSESEIAPDVVDDARTNKSVAFLCREHLQELTQMVARGETANTMVHALVGWISRFGRITF